MRDRISGVGGSLTALATLFRDRLVDREALFRPGVRNLAFCMGNATAPAGPTMVGPAP